MISTGFPDLGRVVGGWSPGDLVVVAARPGMGKTSLLLSFVEAATSAYDRAALMFSMKMGKVRSTFAPSHTSPESPSLPSRSRRACPMMTGMFFRGSPPRWMRSDSS